MLKINTTITCNEGEEWIFLVERESKGNSTTIVNAFVSEDEAIQWGKEHFSSTTRWRIVAMDVSDTPGIVLAKNVPTNVIDKRITGTKLVKNPASPPSCEVCEE